MKNKTEKMIKTAEQYLASRELKKIVDECPIAIKDVIKFYDQPRNEIKFLRGISCKTPWRKVGLSSFVDKLGFSEYGIGLSAYCDNIPETLLHEACHIYRAKHNIERENEKQDEKETDFMTIEYFAFEDVRKHMVKRTIKLLEEKGY